MPAMLTGSMNDQEWENGRGVNCRQCGREVFRIINGRCLACHEGRTTDEVMKADLKRRKRSAMRLLNSGKITLADLRAGRA